MAAYLRENPPVRSQYRSPRRARPTGLLVWHTAESVMDSVGPDTGAEVVAGFIRTRDTPGSYHQLCDSDSLILEVEFFDEAYGDGTGSNPYAIHISAACRTTDWAVMSAGRRAGFVAQLAGAAVEAMLWLNRVHGVTVPLRRLSREQSEAGLAGHISHGERDPGRRSDPGGNFPWNDLFGAIARLSGPREIIRETPAPRWKDDDMRVIQQRARGIAVIGGQSGYVPCRSAEDVNVAVDLFGAPHVFPDGASGEADFDRAARFGRGETPEIDVDEQALAVAILREWERTRAAAFSA